MLSEFDQVRLRSRFYSHSVDDHHDDVNVRTNYENGSEVHHRVVHGAHSGCPQEKNPHGMIRARMMKKTKI